MESMFEALWTPFWYALDQSLKVGQVDDFSFFVRVPEYITVGDMPVLYHGLVHDGELTDRRCKVERIVHAQLGDLTEVAIRGFDYVFFLPSGDEIEVNAEEEPGVAYDFPLEIDDWSLTVFFEPVTVPSAISSDSEPPSTQETRGPVLTPGKFLSQLATLVAANRNAEAFAFFKANFADVHQQITPEERMLIADWMEGVDTALDLEAAESGTWQTDL